MANLLTEELYHLLVEKQALIQDPIIVPHGYPSLKAQTIQQELGDEIDALLTLLKQGIDVFRQGFLARCKQRAEQNAGTCLSLFAMPEGECNQLYWQIAERLFEPQTMGDMLALLLPDNTLLISYEVTEETRQQSLRERVKNPVFHFEAKNLACLTQEPSPAALSQFAVSGRQLFDVTDLVQWEFTTHTKFFNSLSQQYPELAEALYQHNETFKKLRQHLLAVSKGQSPREVIKEFIQQFLLGGETLTGETYASLEAQRAATDFFVYLESLPDTLKEALFELETLSSGISLDYVCEHLRAENCVEQAAGYLQEILNNKENAAILDTRPDLSPEQLQRIHKSYGKSHALSSVSDSPTALPLHYLKKNLEELVIKDMHVLLDLLLAFPPGYYPLLFKYAQISYDATSLGEMMASGIFLGEQLTAINQAILDNRETLGGFSACLQFALDHHNDELVKLIFSLLAQEEQPAAFLIEQLGGFSESLRIAIAHKNYELLKLILTSLPLEERLAALVEAKLSDGTPMLAFATVRMPSQFHWILELLPEEHRLTAITATEGHPTVLYLTADPEVIGTTLSLLPEKDRLTALRTERRGKSGLFRGALHIEVFKVMLALLPPTDRLNAVTERIFSDLNALEVTLSRDVFKEILNLLPEIVPPPPNAAHSAKQNEQIATLYNHIQQLKNHGLELYNQIDDRNAEATGKKVISLAISLSHFANRVISAQTDAEQQVAQKYFLEVLQQALPDLRYPEWKATISDIVLAAMAYAPTPSEELGTMITSGLFNSGQLDDLNQLLIENTAQLAGFSANLEFAITYKNYGLVKLIISSLSTEERLATLLEARTANNEGILHFASRQIPEGFSLILELLPPADRLDAVTADLVNGQILLRRIIVREDFEAALNLLPVVVTPTNPAYSVKKNEQIQALSNKINQLKSYGLKLYNQPNDKKAETEGKKALCLAISLSHFANQFIHAQNEAEQEAAQRKFQQGLQQSMFDMQHRALWKPILANIVIAATGLGLLAIGWKLYMTGTTFFMQTERHKQMAKIATDFTALLAEEPRSSANSSADEIASLLKTSLSGPST
ncbi:hypothetical protein [Legionella donaldsonii]|uniref:hypothetical protein n=1 Tax=Legionella donaldsonii TaxID=45060 RepID=UPI00399C50DC